MRSLISILVLSFAVVSTANAKSKAPAACGETVKVTEAAEQSISASKEPHGSDPRFVIRTKDLDRWEVDMVSQDICYRTISVFMEAGTCKVDHINKGHETCTDN